MSNKPTLFKTTVDRVNQAVRVAFNDRSVTVQKDKNIENDVTHGIYFERPEDGINQNDTLGHFIEDGRSVTCFGVSEDAAAALAGALNTYLNEFGNKKSQ